MPACEVFDDMEKRFGVRPSLVNTVQQELDRTSRKEGKLPERKAKTTSLSKASETINAPSEEKVDARDMWTEISKDLVSADAIKDVGWEYKETKDYYYVMEYLEYVSRKSFDRNILSTCRMKYSISSIFPSNLERVLIFLVSQPAELIPPRSKAGH